jgi:ADP-ribose pyrophosphatase YjhB (NUDIX family)
MEQNITQKLLVQSPKALQALLLSNGIDLSQWGQHDAKTVTDLWQELVVGEAYLQDPPLRRIVPGVVRLIIRQGNCLLIEVQQTFRDGRTRSRGIPPSEKLRRGESYRDGALRCVEEELRVERRHVQVLAQTHQVHHACRRSRSYPGLHSQHTFHTVDVQVEGLPQGAFSTDEYRQQDGALSVRNSWAWQEPRCHAAAFADPDEEESLPFRAAVP